MNRCMRGSWLLLLLLVGAVAEARTIDSLVSDLEEDDAGGGFAGANAVAAPGKDVGEEEAGYAEAHQKELAAQLAKPPQDDKTGDKALGEALRIEQALERSASNESGTDWLSALTSTDHSAEFHYQIGDWLNTPKLQPNCGIGCAQWQQKYESTHIPYFFGRDGHTPAVLSMFPDSVAAEYINKSEAAGKLTFKDTPDIPLLKSILAERGASQPGPDPNELVVHLRLGDMGGVSPTFTAALTAVVQKQHPKKVTLLCGLHKNDMFKGNPSALAQQTGASIEAVEAELKKLDPQLQVQHLPNRPADQDLIYMSKASSLLVHRGGFSALGALVCQGTVFSSTEFTHYKAIQSRRAQSTKGPDQKWQNQQTLLMPAPANA